MPVTQDQIDKVAGDFTVLLDDVTTMLPPSPGLEIAVMVFKMAEASVLSLMHQNIIHLPGGGAGA